jgi:hypothetical protein
MNNTLNNLMREYAEEARAYDVGADATVAAVRRHRTRRRLGVTAVAALVLAAGGVAYALPRPTTTVTPAQTPAVTVTPTPSVDLPPVIVPRTDAPKLPAHGAVGLGVKTYTVAGAGDGPVTAFLLTADGNTYRIGPYGPPSQDYYRLSPDGRWLVRTHGGVGHLSSTVLRDLTSDASYTLTGAAVTWSADSRWVELIRFRNAVDLDLTAVVDTRQLGHGQPTFVDLHPYADQRILGIDADGNIVLTKPGVTDWLNLTVVDRHTGMKLQRDDLTLVEFLTADERAAGAQDWASDPTVAYGQYAPSVLTGDGLLYLQIASRVTTPTGHAGGDVLVIDVAAGTPRERITIPPPVKVGGGWESWRLMRVLPEGLLLAHDSHTDWRYGLGWVKSWDLYQPATGRLTVLTDLSALSPPR